MKTASKLTFSTYFVHNNLLYKNGDILHYWSPKQTAWIASNLGTMHDKKEFISKDEARFMYPAAFSKKNKI